MVYDSRRNQSSGKCRTHRRKPNRQVEMLTRTLFFPALFVYLELVLHLFMKMNMKYFPVILIYSISGGLLFSALTMPFPKKVNRILTRVFAWIFPLIFIIEMICKQLLQSYYQVRMIKVAAGNHLTDYADAVIAMIWKDIPIILAFFLPAILICIFGRRIANYRKINLTLTGMTLALAVVTHLLGLAVLHMPWKGDLTPKMLYHMDTNVDDQVEQLGLLNMLRLDMKHMIIPPRNAMDDDFSGIGEFGGPDDTPETTPAGSDDIETSTEESTEDSDPVIDTSPNVMNIDLAKLAEETSNDDIKWLANYFNSITPTKKNEYTGMFEGYNLIEFVIEGFSGYVIDPILTPTLYKLSQEGFVFNNFYTPLHFTSTSNGECQTLLGLYPKNGFPTTMTRTGEIDFNPYFSLGRQPGREGYQVLGYHANGDMYGRQASHTNLGYDWIQYKHGLELEMNSEGTKPLWPQKDTYLIEASADDYMNSDQPFHIYYLTISGHYPYSENRAVKPYLDTVRALPYTEKTQNYIATMMEADRALQLLLEKLEAAGKLENTLIVAGGDHIPYFDVDSLEELAGKKFGDSKDFEYLKEGSIDFDVYKSKLILWSASMEQPVQVDKVCGLVDILPTLSNLLGLEYDSRMLTGTDILSESEGLVIFTSRSWKSDRGFYNRFSGEFTPAEGVSMSAEEQETYVSAMKKLVKYKPECTEMIVENDFYGKAFGNE